VKRGGLGGHSLRLLAMWRRETPICAERERDCLGPLRSFAREGDIGPGGTSGMEWEHNEEIRREDY
jgi:hypothetical protein